MKIVRTSELIWLVIPLVGGVRRVSVPECSTVLRSRKLNAFWFEIACSIEAVLVNGETVIFQNHDNVATSPLYIVDGESLSYPVISAGVAKLGVVRLRTGDLIQPFGRYEFLNSALMMDTPLPVNGRLTLNEDTDWRFLKVEAESPLSPFEKTFNGPASHR